MQRTFVVLVAAVCAACGQAAGGAETGDDSTLGSPAPTPIDSTAPTSSLTPVMPTSAPIAGPLATTTTSADGIELTLESASLVGAGDRLPILVTVRNVGDAPVFWQSGGCAIPAAVSVAPASEPHPSTGGLIDQSWAYTWDGDPTSLATIVAGNVPVLRQQGQSAESTAVHAIACPANWEMSALEPGESLTYHSTAEIRVPVGPLPDDGSYTIVAGFAGDVLPEAEPTAPFALWAELPLTVVDDPSRTGGIDEIAAAILADGRLTSWIPTTAVADQPQLVQSYAATLDWWRGAWELWVQPYWNGARRLRVRIDPASMLVVDVRQVWSSFAPQDEPGAAPNPNGVTEVILTEPCPSIPPTSVAIVDSVKVPISSPTPPRPTPC